MSSKMIVSILVKALQDITELTKFDVDYNEQVKLKQLADSYENNIKIGKIIKKAVEDAEQYAKNGCINLPLHEIFCVCAKRSDDLFPGFHKVMYKNVSVDENDAVGLAEVLADRLECDMVVWKLIIGVNEMESTIVKFKK